LVSVSISHRWIIPRELPTASTLPLAERAMAPNQLVSGCASRRTAPAAASQITISPESAVKSVGPLGDQVKNQDSSPLNSIGSSGGHGSWAWCNAVLVCQMSIQG